MKINQKILIILILIIAGLFIFLILKRSLPEPPVGEYKTEDVTFTLQSPNGYDLRVRTVGPKLSEYPDEKFPVVLRIAGGWGEMTGELDSKNTKKYASKGFIFVAFDSEVRIKNPILSEKRDYSGFKDQADVAFVLKNIIDKLNPSILGIWSHSSGALLTAGVLGRYPEISKRVDFWLDDEGPHCPEELMSLTNLNPSHQGASNWEQVMDIKVGKGKDYGSEEDFWYERCTYKFLGSYTGIYQRTQGKNDHALGYNYLHAISYLNTATRGNAKWTRLNKQPINQIYKSDQEPNGIYIGSVLDIEKFDSPNDEYVWGILLDLF